MKSISCPIFLTNRSQCSNWILLMGLWHSLRLNKVTTLHTVYDKLRTPMNKAISRLTWWCHHIVYMSWSCLNSWREVVGQWVLFNPLSPELGNTQTCQRNVMYERTQYCWYETSNFDGDITILCGCWLCLLSLVVYLSQPKIPFLLKVYWAGDPLCNRNSFKDPLQQKCNHIRL